MTTMGAAEAEVFPVLAEHRHRVHRERLNRALRETLDPHRVETLRAVVPAEGTSPLPKPEGLGYHQERRDSSPAGQVVAAS